MHGIRHMRYAHLIMVVGGLVLATGPMADGQILVEEQFEPAPAVAEQCCSQPLTHADKSWTQPLPHRRDVRGVPKLRTDFWASDKIGGGVAPGFKRPVTNSRANGQVNTILSSGGQRRIQRSRTKTSAVAGQGKSVRLLTTPRKRMRAAFKKIPGNGKRKPFTSRKSHLRSEDFRAGAALVGHQSESALIMSRGIRQRGGIVTGTIDRDARRNIELGSQSAE